MRLWLAFVFVLCGQIQAAPSLVQTISGGHVQWSDEMSKGMTFGSSVTGGNTVVCTASLYNGGGDVTLNVPTDTASNTYVVVPDSSSGTADSGTPVVETRSVVWASYAVTGGFTTVTLSTGSMASYYGQSSCSEWSGLDGTADDRTCADNLAGTAGDDAEANCTLGTLVQAEELVVAVLANSSDGDSNVNISGPSGAGCTWSNIYREQDAATSVGGSSDYCTTSATTGGSIDYSHDDLPGTLDDWSMAVATFRAAAGTTTTLFSRRRH